MYAVSAGRCSAGDIRTLLGAATAATTGGLNNKNISRIQIRLVTAIQFLACSIPPFDKISADLAGFAPGEAVGWNYSMTRKN